MGQARFRAGAAQRHQSLHDPHVQEGLLLGDLHLSERRIRDLVAGAEWDGSPAPYE